MYIRLLNFKTKANKKDAAIGIMNEVIPQIRAQKGCQDCMFLVMEEEDRYALLVLWESREHADHAAPIIGPILLPALNQISMEPVVPRLYEVYQTEPAVI